MNIILIGFKSCGKTTCGHKLAKLLKKDFIDLDEEIEKLFFQKHKNKKVCFEIFSIYKEKYFRSLEREVVEKIAKEKDVVIATGGGTVSDINNINLLNGVFIYLFLPFFKARKRIKALPYKCFHKKMPFYKLLQLYRKRHKIYEDCSDHIVSADDNIETILFKVSYGQ